GDEIAHPEQNGTLVEQSVLGVVARSELKRQPSLRLHHEAADAACSVEDCRHARLIVDLLHILGRRFSVPLAGFSGRNEALAIEEKCVGCIKCNAPDFSIGAPLPGTSRDLRNSGHGPAQAHRTGWRLTAVDKTQLRLCTCGPRRDFYRYRISGGPGETNVE